VYGPRDDIGRGMDLCQRAVGTNVRNVSKNVGGHKSLRFLTTREIRTINGVQMLMDLQYIIQTCFYNFIYINMCALCTSVELR